MRTCPFCGRDPFHYVDNGLGMEAVAVDCCELGDLYYRGARPAPDDIITMSWEDFSEIGSKLSEARAVPMEEIVDVLETMLPLLPIGYASTSRPGSADDANARLDGIRVRARSLLSRLKEMDGGETE